MNGCEGRGAPTPQAFDGTKHLISLSHVQYILMFIIVVSSIALYFICIALFVELRKVCVTSVYFVIGQQGQLSRGPEGSERACEEMRDESD